MPVRFRCETCHGKLSIATRKIGMTVECPRCRESMIVPSASQIGEELTELLAAVGGKRDAAETGEGERLPSQTTKVVRSLEEMPLFGRSDYEKLLDPRAKGAKPLPLPAETPKPSAPVPHPATDHLNYTDAIVISRAKATVLAVGVVALLGFAFGLGFLVRG